MEVRFCSYPLQNLTWLKLAAMKLLVSVGLSKKLFDLDGNFEQGQSFDLAHCLLSDPQVFGHFFGSAHWFKLLGNLPANPDSVALD
jgi:hypothetical protein